MDTNEPQKSDGTNEADELREIGRHVEYERTDETGRVSLRITIIVEASETRRRYAN